MGGLARLGKGITRQFSETIIADIWHLTKSRHDVTEKKQSAEKA
jgi:hypothetical protein